MAEALATMARSRDEQKRDRILRASKKLFARNGYANTSVSDIVAETDLPVGTIYTYFEKKEEIITTIVQEGWDDFLDHLSGIGHSGKPGIDCLRVIIDDIIPSLLNDLDFLNILLTEAIVYTRIEEKLEKIIDVLFEIIREIPEAQPRIESLSRRMFKTALVIYFLGILSAANLSRTTAADITNGDITSFLKHSVVSFIGTPI